MKYRKQIICSGIISMCSVLVLLSCVKEAKEDFFLKIQSVSGTVDLMRDGAERPVKKDLVVETGDVIKTGKGSYVSIYIRKTRVLYLNENTKVKIEYLWEENDSTLGITVGVAYGKIFSDFISSKDISCAFAVFTSSGSIVGKESSFYVAYHRNKEVSIIKAFKEQVAVFPNNQECIDVPECNKILITNDGNVSRLVSITDKDIDELKTCVDINKVESIVAVSGCFDVQKEEENLPPVWEGKPKRSCRPGVAFVDKMSARDPEGAVVRYFLVKGPHGMKISAKRGVLNYKPKRSGTFEVRISAEDEDGNASLLKYYLTVVGNLNAVLRIPEMVKAGEEFKIDASRSVNAKGNKGGLLYRFDINRDGKWDYPATGAFEKEASVMHSYKIPGEYTVTAQIKDQDGKTAKASKTITVTVPPEIQITHVPLFGTVGTEYTLSVKGAKPRTRLQVRWDLNGDGRWDYPRDGSFSSATQLRHMWDKPGKYKVLVEAEDVNKNRVSVSKEVTVYQGITIEALQGPDTVNINENITYKCIAKDPVFAIVEYAWDFAGVGMFGEKSKKPSVTFSYKEAGIYTLVCCVTNEKGMSASETKDIIVLNFTTTIDAGGPYKAHVNVPLKVKGFAKDVDNKIVSYFWDFDNDKKFEWNSDKTSETEHVFSSRGTYVIRFGAKADDGTMSEDTAVVTVDNRPPKALAGEDIVSRKRKKVKLNGIGKDPDGNVVKYEWDFNGDGTFDWSSKDTGYTEHDFLKYSSAIFKVTDKEGSSAYDTVRIVICPRGMVTIKKGKYCIDKYEWPNKIDSIPVTNITHARASAKCKKVGKRLCTYEEMITACQGEKKKYKYPYGKWYEPFNCNSYGNKRIDNRKAISGEFQNCVSSYGVYDMSGNVAEWVSTGEGKHKYVVGGWWQNGEKRVKCDSYMELEKKKKYMYVGFRCCK